MKNLLIAIALLMTTSLTLNAQRVTDQLTRGLVAIPQGDKTGQGKDYGPSGSGMFITWRILPTEYYDTKYNLYRNGTKIATELTVSNYQDNGGTSTSKYYVVPVIRGKERTDLKSAEVTPWSHQFIDIPVQAVVGRNGKTASGYTLNDCSVADVDGDGQMEFVVKRRNDSGNLRTEGNTNNFNLHECYKIDGTRLWWIDMGPNMMAGPDEQFDLILYDWDRDGKAEALMRGADNMIIHTATGKTIKIGDMSYYAPREEYTYHGAEYLLYLNGATGEPYGWDGSDNWTPEAYPLPRFESGEAADVLNPTSSEYAAVWGSADTGHRSCKHYFGAPYLDGRNPSIFLGRGCYTRHKFCALDVDPATHKLTQRWRWNSYDTSSPWYGNGFHNFAIADVDMDGRDEIVFGSMIIDDTGYGLSTTGYGHGDAQHCGDLDPYRWGLEQFVCLESSTAPGVCYTDATSSDIRYQNGSGGDNGRCMAGNFQSVYPGAVGRSAAGGLISFASDKVIEGATQMSSDDYWNMRIYWDGDLLDEFMDSPGVERAPVVYKYAGQKEVGTGRSTYKYDRCFQGEGSLNNSSKNNPCFLGDIIGDWREEIVVRVGDALRIYTSSYATPWGITTLWADHEYRNAMTWQSVGYNQPPHPSFFLGELEGITKEPPALTLEGRTEVSGSISTTDDHLLISGYENKTIAVTDGASPYILTVNTPAWVKGSGAMQATASTPKQPAREVVTYTTTLTGGAFSGATRLVKQGEGTLVLPTVTEKHTGATDVWNGTLRFDGTFESSPLWLNRHTTLISNGGIFNGGIKADYNATILPGGNGTIGTITTTTLALGFGSRIVFDVSGSNNDRVDATALTIETKTDDVWKNYGPRYKAPVVQINSTGTLAAGTYLLGNVGTLTGNLSEVIIEGLGNTSKASLVYDSKQLKLVVEDMRAATTVYWNGTAANNTCDMARTQNFLNGGVADYAAYNDNIIFDDKAANTTVVVKGAVSPASVTFANDTKAYTLNGDSIVGAAPIVKNGKADVIINNWNRTGATTVNAGTLTVSMLANTAGQNYGSLGDASQPIRLKNGTTLCTNGTIITDQPLTISGVSTVDVPLGKSVIFNKGISGSGATLVKSGEGSMETGAEATNISKLIVKGGTMYANYSSSNVDQLPATVEFQGGTLWGANMEGGSGVTNKAKFVVAEGQEGTFYGSYRGTYSGTLTGSGTFNVYTGGVRCYYQGDWSAFSGTINVGKNNRQNKKSYDPNFMYTNKKGLPLAIVNVAANTRFSTEGTAMTVRQLGGEGAIVGTSMWTVKSDEDFTLTTEVGITSERKDDYDNKISVSATPLTKSGSGKMTMIAGRMNGALTVDGGTVAFYNAELDTLLNGSNATTVKGTGCIVGHGLLSSLTVESGATLMPCGATDNETTPGTIKVSDKATINSGATLNIIISPSTGTSQLQAKTLTMNGKVVLTLGDDYKPASGDKFTLWTASSSFSGKPTYELPALPAGLEWDVTALAAETGVITITGSPLTLGDVNGDGSVNVVDVTGTISYILGQKPADFNASVADVNGDGSINVVDVTTIIDIILGKDKKE